MKRLLSLLLALLLCPLGQALAQSAPDIPADFPQPRPFPLEKDQKYPVYTGPGEDYARAGEGKAMLSTKGWVQAFGQEDGWLLVQYGIDKGRMRVGYIRPPRLMPDVIWGLHWHERRGTLVQSLTLSDDPLGKGAACGALKPGSEYIHLADMGDWQYLEGLGQEGPLRGFARYADMEKALLRDESQPFRISAHSYGPIADDHATRRYYKSHGDHHWQGTAEGLPNIWLRLSSPERAMDLEKLHDFRVIKGKASCAPLPVSFLDVSQDNMDWSHHRFLTWGDSRRAALELRLAEGERMQNLVIACTRSIQEAGKPDRVETLTLDLSQVVADRGTPPGAVTFAATQYTAFTRTREQLANIAANSSLPDAYTLAGVLADVFQPMPDAPEKVLGQPLNTADYGFYLIEGSYTRHPGHWGVYDVAFELVNPPEGVWLANRQACGSCDEMDSFDTYGGEIRIVRQDLIEQDTAAIRRMTQTRPLAILLLVAKQGRDEQQIDDIIRSLRVQAVFSAEKWDVLWEQHYIATAIGPRSREPLVMADIQKIEGIRQHIREGD